MDLSTPFESTHQSIPRPSVSSEADRSFYAQAEAYLDEMMRLNPYVATLLGYHRYDNLMDDMSREGIAAKVAFYEGEALRFAAIDGRTLSMGAAIDLDLITTDIDSNLFSLKELRPHENDPQIYNDIIGYGTLYLTILEPNAKEWPERLSALLSRMEALPGFLDAARANLRNPAKVVTQFITEKNPGNIAFFEMTLPPLFARFPDLDARFRAELPRTLSALKAYQSFLETDLKARATGDWRLGDALWTRKLRFSLQSDLSPEQIQQRAWAQLRKERDAMLALAQPMHQRMFPGHSHTETGDDLVNAILKEVLAEVSSRHSTPELLPADCRKWVERIKTFIRDKQVITLPPETDNFVIEPTPAFLDGMAVAFFNPAPAFEPRMKKSFWISSIPQTGDAAMDAQRAESYLREYNDYGLQNLCIHEAFPGHYVQFYYALTSPIASIYKKVFTSSTFAEGWAVLCEEQMFNLGYAGEKERFAEGLLMHKKMNLRAPLNAILDARLHTARMSEEEADRWALELMQRYGFQEETEAVGKLRRAKVSSTQLSTYFVGFLELSDLMEEYRSLKGAAFSLREFNEKLLSFGTIPPRAVRRLMLGA